MLKGIEELDELEDLYRRQMARIEMGMGFENATKILNRHLNQEMALAVDILRKRHNIKMDLGVGGGRNLGSVTVRPELMMDVRERYDDETYSAIQDPESRNKVLSIVRSLKEIGAVDGEILDVVNDQE